MQIRAATREFLLTNNQFQGKLNFNHEALAIFLKHTLKPHKPQTFMIAGSEDLRALLPRLSLQSPGE